MADSEDKLHRKAAELYSESDSDGLHPISGSSDMGLVPTLSPATKDPPSSIQREASLSLDYADSQSTSGSSGDTNSSPSNGRRVRFDHNIDTDTKGSPPTGQVLTLVDTPPRLMISPDGNSKLSGSYFDSHPGGEAQPLEEVGEVEEDNIGTLSPLPRASHPTTKRLIFGKEMWAALERIPRDKITLQDRKKLMNLLGSYSAPVSAQVSPTLTPRTSLEGETRNGPPGCKGSLSMSLEDLEMDVHAEAAQDKPKEDRTHQTVTTEAHKLVRAHTQKGSQGLRFDRRKPSRDLESGASTPVDEEMDAEQIRSGVLTTLLKLYNAQNSTPHNHRSSVPTTPPVSGRTTPKWYKSANCSVISLVGFGLTGSSQTLTSPESLGGSSGATPTDVRIPKSKRGPSGTISGMLNKFNKPSVAEEIKITIHIAKLLSRQKYVLKLCKALMLYGVSKDIQICKRVGT